MATLIVLLGSYANEAQLNASDPLSIRNLRLADPNGHQTSERRDAEAARTGRGPIHSAGRHDDRSLHAMPSHDALVEAAAFVPFVEVADPHE